MEAGKDDARTKLKSLNLSQMWAQPVKFICWRHVTSTKVFSEQSALKKKDGDKIFIMPPRPVVKGPCVRIKCDEYSQF